MIEYIASIVALYFWAGMLTLGYTWMDDNYHFGQEEVHRSALFRVFAWPVIWFLRLRDVFRRIANRQ